MVISTKFKIDLLTNWEQDSYLPALVFLNCSRPILTLTALRCWKCYGIIRWYDLLWLADAQYINKEPVKVIDFNGFTKNSTQKFAQTRSQGENKKNEGGKDLLNDFI